MPRPRPDEVKRAGKINEKEKNISPEKIIRSALSTMEKIIKNKDDVGKKRWENKLHEYGLSGKFEDIYNDLKLAANNMVLYAVKNSMKVKNIIDNLNDIMTFLDSERENIET